MVIYSSEFTIEMIEITALAGMAEGETGMTEEESVTLRSVIVAALA